VRARSRHRLRRGVLLGGALVLGAVLAGVAAVGLTLALLPALDLSRYQTRSALVSARDGELLHVALAADERWRLHTTPAMVSPRYLEALLAIEDRHFHLHPGVNPFALARAAWQWARHGRVVSGGSTLTMQVVRLLEPRPRTLRSKWIELVRALELEWRHPKDEILAMYLTMVPMGGNAESVRVAAHHYLDTDPRQLSLADVAVLLAIPQSPEQRRPDRHAERTREAAARIAERLIARGLFAAHDVDELALLPLGSARRFPQHAWHLSGQLIRQTSDASAAAGIGSTIDLRLQRTLEDKVQALRPALGPRQNVAAMVLDAATGELLAHVGSLGLDSESGFMDLTQALRSPGSTLKPFVYGMAMDDGLISDQTVLIDQPTRFGAYAPVNFEGAHQGPVRVGTALQASLNVPAVLVMEQLGAGLFLDVWAQAGLGYALPDGASPNVAVALGALGVRLVDLVLAYAALANDGHVPALRTRLDTDTERPRQRLLTAASAHTLSAILAAAPMVDGRLHRAWSGSGAVPAFKTGTSYGHRDAWAIGGTGGHVVGVWIGRPDGAPVPGMTGRALALRLAMDLADQLPSGPRPDAWRALPIGGQAEAAHRPPPQVIRPEPDANLLLHAPPHPERSIALQLSGVSETTVLYVNGEPLGHLDAIPVPHDGGYRVEVFDAHTRVQVLELHIMSERR